MSMLILRRVVVSSLVLGAFATLSDVVLAEDKPIVIHYECTIPTTGSERCGDANRNIRVGPLKRLTIQLDQIPYDPRNPIKVTFTVFHAVTNNQLAASREMSQPGEGDRVWTNPKDEAVDVYVTVKSNAWGKVDIAGRYVIDKP